MGEKGEMEVIEAPHTQFFLTICLVNLNYLYHGHPNRGLNCHTPSIRGWRCCDEQQDNVQW